MNATKKKSWLSRTAPYLLGIYCISVGLFFMAELGWFGLDEHLRATNQVLILFALLLLPFIVMNMPNFVQSLTLKVSDKEFHVQLNELQDSFSGTLGKVEKQVSTAEQSLWPMLAGVDINSDARLCGQTRKIIIGSKLDPSQMFFTELLAQTLERFVDNIECEIRYPNGGSLRNFADVKYRWIDMYIDYTGTCCEYFNIHHKNPDGELKSDDTVVEELNLYGERIGLEWLRPWGASEDYCLTMEPEMAKKHNVKSLRDLKECAHRLTFSADPEFLNRKDCYLGLKTYGIVFKELLPCHISNRYAALETSEASVYVGYESDPQIADEEVLKLSDPDHFFPPYKVLPLVSRAALEQVPEIRIALNKLAGQLSTNKLNAVVVSLANEGNRPGYAKDEAERFLNSIFSH